MRGRIERVAEPAAHFIARDDRGEHVAARGAGDLADRERGRHHRRARMQRRIRMRVVEIERMAERAVEQRGDRRRPGLAVAEHGGLRPCRRAPSASSIFSSEGVDSASRRARMALPRKSSVSTLARVQHFLRDILEFQVGDIGGERCGFIGHRVSSRLPNRVGGLIPGFKPPVGGGQQPCRMSFIRDRL